MRNGLLLTLTARASAGTRVSQEQVDKFERGKTTYTEVVAALGRPNANTMSADGNRIAVYSHSQAAARPETFIPIVGAFVGGADAQASTVLFRFNREGVLVDWQTSQSNISGGTGAR